MLKLKTKIIEKIKPRIAIFVWGKEMRGNEGQAIVIKYLRKKNR
jgi:hypothetical protein